MKTQNIALNKEISPIISQANDLKITNGAAMGNAVEMLSKANKLLDRITEERERITKPLNEALKAERSRWKPIETVLNEAIDSIRAKMSSYQTAQIASQRASESKIADKLSSGSISLEKAITKIEGITVPEVKVATEAGSVSFKEVKRFRITDKAKIPLEFMIPDEKTITEAMRSGEFIEGIEYYTEQVPINRRF